MRKLFLPENIEPGALWPLHVREESGSEARTWIRMGSIAVGFGALCVIGSFFAVDKFRISIFWPGNGILVAYLLTRSSREWRKFLIVALVGNIAAYCLFVPFGESLSLAFCNISEVVVALWFLRRALCRYGDLAASGMMIEFLLYAVMLAPVVAVSAAAAFMTLAHAIPFWQTIRLWLAGDSIGMALMVPITLALIDPERKILSRQTPKVTIGVLLGIPMVSYLVFGEIHLLFFLLVPALVWTVFQAGLFTSYLALLEILIVGAQFTIHRLGPFWRPEGSTLEGSVVRLQLYILAMMASLVPIGTILERQRHLQRTLQHGLMRYRLLADNSRDIVVLSTLEGRRLYASPAVTDVLGWTPEEWTGQISAMWMHPDDVGPFRRLMKEMLQGRDRRIFRYRTRHKDGRYLWIEANIRTLHDEDTGEPNAYVANLREISRRVESEQKLASAYEQMQQQVQQDGLTGLANRRRFDEAMDAEWRRGRRTGMPIALLMIDIDNFKYINDTYGHRAGDHCLQAVAGCLQQLARRPSDLAARYGGEEFALLLPDVELAPAMALAERLCQKIRDLRIEAGVGTTLRLTVSLGAAAEIPGKHFRSDALVEAADRALYAAKQAGRNQVMLGAIEAMSPVPLYRVQ